MKTLLNRITCKFFGYCVYKYQVATKLVKKEDFLTDKWLFIVVSCSRCEEQCFTSEFPIFVKAAKLVFEKETMKKKQERLMEELGLNKVGKI